MSGVQHLEIEPAEAGQRLDRWLRGRFPQLTQGRIEKMLRKGEVRVDGGRARSNTRIAAHQMVRVPPVPEESGPAPECPAASPEDAAFLRSLILYEDDEMIVFNKPPGLPVQGGTGQARHIDGMLDALAEGGERPRLVHRIDKDTSGLLIVAKTAPAARALTAAFRSKAARKLYWAAVSGVPKPQAGTISYPLEKAPGAHGEKMVCVDPRDLAAHPEAKRAVTDYATVDSAGRKLSWVVLRPVTGRTHQLRAHMARIGCAILGDGKYGPPAASDERRVTGGLSRKLHLHARSLTVPHPDGSGRMVSLRAPLPEHMRRSWETFGWDPERDDDDLLPEPPR